MPQATWGEWFVGDEIEGATPDSVAIWYLGCNGFVLRSAETTLYIDPYFGTGVPKRTTRMIPVPIDPETVTECDAVFVSHEHIDHMHPPSFEPYIGDGVQVYGAKPSFENPSYDGELPAAEHRRLVTPHESIGVGDFDVHVRAANDPDAQGDVSYVVEHETGTFLHVGDSRPAESFHDVAAEFDVDVGALALGSAGTISDPVDAEARRTTWYMDENEVVEAANALQLDRLLPVHYDMWKGVGADPAALHHHAASFQYPRTITHVEIGDRVDIDRPGIVPMAHLR